ncbi:MAG: hypothetical protein JO061_17185 [Acidobacteriaceae bacterium]|nr:hypothetical protein [Acidobacteriaceae bacterium]
MKALLLMFVMCASAVAAEIPPDAALAIKGWNEWARVCQPDGMLLWGQSLCGPLLWVNPSTRFAIATAPDPEGRFQKYADVYIGAFPEGFTPSNTSIHWGQQNWATVMLPLPADPFQRLALLAHESFHRIQPSLGLSASDAPDPSLDTEAGRLWLRLELRALAAALRSTGATARQSATDAMLFRAQRHRLCPGSAEMEAAMEKQEGLAEYTGVFIAFRETHEDINREARIIEGFEDSDSFARSFGYATGPALGLLLDRYASGWRARAASAASLDSMLASALHFQPPKDLERVAVERAALYAYSAVTSAERDREERHAAFLSELSSKFLEHPTLDFPTAPEMTRNFNPGNLVPFPPHGTYYPTGTFAAGWGKLQVESGGALVAPDNRSLRVSAPPDPDARPVRGAGWVLELTPGWTIRPSGNSGSFTLAAPAH